METVLKTECVGVSKAVHILRAAGVTSLASGTSTCDSLGRTLNGEVDDHSQRQAVDGFNQGGLNWRTGLDLALPAFLSSQMASRPAVEALLSSVVEAGMGGPEMLLETYDARTTAALDDLALVFRRCGGCSCLVEKIDVVGGRRGGRARGTGCSSPGGVSGG